MSTLPTTVSRSVAFLSVAATCLVAISSAASASVHASASSAALTKCGVQLNDELTKLNVPGLSAGIIKNGQLACTTTAGLADIATHQEITPDTSFLVASITKTVTTTALMQLQEHSTFQLDDDIDRQLPFTIRSPYCPEKPVTYRQLLTHTSPIKDYPDLDKLPVDQLLPGDSTVPLDDYLKSWLVPGGEHYTKANFYRQWCSGAHYHYTNLGFVVAGDLVEHISHRGLDEYAKTHILDPLGMEQTSYFLRRLNQSRIATPYQNPAPGQFDPLWQYGELDWPDGMLRTSVPQLARFLTMFMQGGTYDGHQILKPETVAEIRRIQFPDSHGELAKQGLCWFYNSFDNGPKVLGHDGEDNGAAAYMFFDPKVNTGVILMANADWFDKDGDAPKADDLIARLFAQS